MINSHKKSSKTDHPDSTYTLPRQSTIHTSKLDFEDSIISSNSLPRNFSISNPSSDTFNQSGGNLKKKWGMNTNMNGLYAGLQQLRCLLELLPPGVLPDETIVGTILDLVSRCVFISLMCNFE